MMHEQYKISYAYFRKQSKLHNTRYLYEWRNEFIETVEYLAEQTTTSNRTFTWHICHLNLLMQYFTYNVTHFFNSQTRVEMCMYLRERHKRIRCRWSLIAIMYNTIIMGLLRRDAVPADPTLRNICMQMLWLVHNAGGVAQILVVMRRRRRLDKGQSFRKDSMILNYVV